MGMDEIWSEYEELKNENEYLKEEQNSLQNKIRELEFKYNELFMKYADIQNKLSEKSEPKIIYKENKRMENEITQWEYKTVSELELRDDEKLNKLGQEGWELSAQVARTGGQTDRTIFKRPKKKQPKKEPDYGYSR